MKYSIIMPYYKKRTLHNTLVSYAHHYRDRDDYEVIVLEDCKNVADKEEHGALLGIVESFNKTVPIRHVETDFKNCYAPCRMFNAGVRMAKGHFIVLTNPECFHLTDVLGAFDGELSKDPDAYVVAACFNAISAGNVDKFKDFKYMQMNWYQHSKHMPRGLHWCSVISKRNYYGVGGFDEGYASGFAREDVDFFRTIEESDIQVVFKDDIIVVHISHPNMSSKLGLLAINQKYYADKWGAMDKR